MDYFHKMTKVFDYERGKVIGILLGALCACLFVGCAPIITSDITGKKVNDQQLQKEIMIGRSGLEQRQTALNREIEIFNVNVESSVERMEKAKEFRVELVNTVAGIAVASATGDPITASQVIASILMLVGLGGTVGGLYDSGRKNKKIIELKDQQDPAGGGVPA